MAEESREPEQAAWRSIMRRLRSPVVTAIVLIASVVVGCGADRLSEPEELSELSEPEAEELAREYQVAAEDCNLSALGQLFDFDAALRRGLLASSLSTQSQRWLYDKTRGRPRVLQNTLCIPEGGHLTLLSLRRFPTNGQNSALFRIDFDEFGGFDYLEVLLGKSRDGRNIADDLYFYSGGWLASEQMRDSSVAVASNYNNSDKFRETLQLLTSDPGAGMTAAKQLSPGVRASKTLMLEVVRASIELGPEAYSQAIKEFSDRFPGDASLDFITIDGLYVLAQWEQLLSTIDKFGQAVGGDPWLDELRLGILVEAKFFERARELVARRVADYQEDETWPHLSVDVELEAKNYPAAIANMKHIAESLGTIWGEELVADDMYPEFGQSKEWKLYN
ncbi:MAG: hypothetical protein JKY56_09270, partial [Kofleriaceae bacterium]|nr:hypothetical protein [Kofleriaceae bacterium]